jgi:hypothetical protein
MSKRYELLIPASFEASARDSRLSKKSCAATADTPLLEEVDLAVNATAMATSVMPEQAEKEGR